MSQRDPKPNEVWIQRSTREAQDPNPLMTGYRPSPLPRRVTEKVHPDGAWWRGFILLPDGREIPTERALKEPPEFYGYEFVSAPRIEMAKVEVEYYP